MEKQPQMCYERMGENAQLCVRLWGGQRASFERAGVSAEGVPQSNHPCLI